jgi:hypothetical protein
VVVGVWVVAGAGAGTAFPRAALVGVVGVEAVRPPPTFEAGKFRANFTHIFRRDRAGPGTQACGPGGGLGSRDDRELPCCRTQ